jgi:hypothetical protein
MKEEMMRVFPRSTWTANIPRNNTMEDHTALPYFTDPPVGIEFVPIHKNLLFIHRNPQDVLNDLFMESITQHPLADIDFNYALSQNTEGVYVIRGAHTKCTNSDKIRVLLLLGENEKPTDVLKRNQRTLLEEVIKNPVPSPTLKIGDHDVHVFDLIELLTERGYYDAANDGYYGPLTVHAVKKMQLDLGFKNFSGVYDEWCYEALTRPHREYIKIA